MFLREYEQRLAPQLSSELDEPILRCIALNAATMRDRMDDESFTPLWRPSLIVDGRATTRLPQTMFLTLTPTSIGLGIRACQAGHRVVFATAAQWVDRLASAHHGDRPYDELIKLGRAPLLIIDEVGYIPFEPEAANLFFQLISARYERASLIVTSNKPFGRWG
jgi:hypothetical protein